MNQIRLVEETEHLINPEWLEKHQVSYFQQDMRNHAREDEEDVFRLITVFVDEKCALMLLLLDRGYMLEILGMNTNADIPTPSIIKQLLRMTERVRIIGFAREYEEKFVAMGLPVVSVNYARPIVPGVMPDPERFTANLGSKFAEQSAFRALVHTTFGDDPAVESILDDDGWLSMLMLEDGTQVGAIISRGDKRWVMSDPLILSGNGIPVSDTVFGRFVYNLIACLPKGNMLIYSSTIQSANNRVAWLITNSFVPESYLHHRTLKE